MRSQTSNQTAKGILTQILREHFDIAAVLTGLSFLECNVWQQVMASDDSQQLQHMSEVGLITATLALKGQQEVSAAPDAATLVLIDYIHKQERQYPDVPVR